MELLIRASDHTGDPNKLRLQGLDVIRIEDDGHAWSQEEKTNPDWRIVKIAGVKKPISIEDQFAELEYDECSWNQYQASLGNEALRDPAEKFQRRAFKLDVTILPGRHSSGIDHVLDMVQLVAATKRRNPLSQGRR